MIESALESEIRVKPGLLGALNNHLLDQISPKLSPEQIRRLRLNLKSIRGRKLISPRDQSKCLLKQFDVNTIEKLAENVDKVADPVEGEFKLGNKILEISPFQQAADRRYRSLQIEDPNQQVVFDYWINNFHKLPENLPLKEKITSTITRPLSCIYNELGFMWSLAKIKSGMAIPNSGKIGKQASNFLIQSSIDSSVKCQLRKDIQSSAMDISDKSRRDQVVKGILTNYQYSDDSLEAMVFSHPDYFPRLAKSLVMNLTYYGGLRQVLGWSAYAAMVKVTVPYTDVTIKIPGTVDFFQSQVDQIGSNPMTWLAGGTLAGLMIARMGVDYYVLKKRDMTPDTFELGLALSSGRVDEYQNLRVNPKFGVTGPLFDVAISSTIFGAAFGVDLPYSIPAYLLAMGVDQISFMGSNLGYLLWSRRNGNNKSIGKENLDA